MLLSVLMRRDRRFSYLSARNTPEMAIRDSTFKGSEQYEFPFNCTNIYGTLEVCLGPLRRTALSLLTVRVGTQVGVQTLSLLCWSASSNSCW